MTRPSTKKVVSEKSASTTGGKKQVEICIVDKKEEIENLDFALPVIASFLDELDNNREYENQNLTSNFGVDAPRISKAVQLKEWSVPDFAIAEELLLKAFSIKGASANLTKQPCASDHTRGVNSVEDSREMREASVKRGRGRPKKSVSRESVEDQQSKTSKPQPFF